MTLRNVRERTTLIARVGRLLADLPVDKRNDLSAVLPHIISYLLAQLKINYRPLYAATVSALAGIGAQQGELIWSMVWQDLEKMSVPGGRQILDLDIKKPEWAVDIDDKDDGHNPEAEEEETDFRCHNLEKSNAIVASAWNATDDARHLDVKEISVGVLLSMRPR